MYTPPAVFPADAAYDALPPIRSARLHLRPFTAADDPALQVLFSDPVALRTWVHPPFTSLDDARAYREGVEAGFARRGLFIWGVFVDDGGAPGPLAGVGILTRWAPIHRRVDLGYYFGSAFWGRGYATETARALARFAFETLGCHRVEAEIVPENDASRRVLVRAGFRFDALLAERLWNGDAGPSDSELYRMLRPELDATAGGATPTGPASGAG